MKIAYEETLENIIAGQMFQLEQMSKLHRADRRSVWRSIIYLICICGFFYWLNEGGRVFQWILMGSIIIGCYSLNRLSKHQRLIYQRLKIAMKPQFKAMPDKRVYWEVNNEGITVSDCYKQLYCRWEQVTKVTLTSQLLAVCISQSEALILPAQPFVEGDYAKFHQFLLETYEHQASQAGQKDTIESSLWQADLEKLKRRDKLTFKKAACWMGVLLVVLVMIYRMSGQAAFENKVNELARAGYPVTMEALEKEYRLPDGVENAADIYQQAFDAYQEPTSKEQEFLPISGNWPDSQNGSYSSMMRVMEISEEETEEGLEYPPYPQEVMDAIAKRMNDNQQTLELLSKATKIERCLFPRSFDDLDAPTPHYIKITGAVKLLCEQNLYLAQKQDKEKLFESLQMIIAMTHIIDLQPSMIDHLVANSVKLLAVENLQDVLSLTAFNEIQLIQLQKQFSDMHAPEMIQQAMINERCGFIVRLNEPISEWSENSGDAVGLDDKLGFYLHSMSGLKANDGFRGLKQIERYLEVFELPEHQRIEYSTIIGDEIKRLGRWHFYVQLTVGRYSHFFQRDIQTVGTLRCAETGLAIQRYQLKHGSLPEDLAALVPELMEAVPVDPFDGQALRYIKHKEGGFTVYSIGEDGIDNNGLSEEHMKANGNRYGEHDLTFTIGTGIHPKRYIIDDKTAERMMMY